MLHFAANIRDYRIPEKYLDYLDYNYIYWQLENYKKEKCYFNITIDRKLLKPILKNETWYYGLILPERELEIDSMEKSKKASSYAVLVFQSYIDKYYKFHKDQWEAPYLEYRDLRCDDYNFVDEYTFTYIDEYEGDTTSLQVEQFVNDVKEMLNRDLRRLIGRELRRFSDKLIAFDVPNQW
jgi:hypothetical protein